MPELILSDITVMGPGYCVIGLEQVSPQAFRSVRPMPPWGFAWREPFPYKRGDSVRVRWKEVPAKPPHVEDRESFGLPAPDRSLSESELIECLREAEAATNLEDLFDCRVQTSTRGGRALWVDPCEAKRSICGCGYENLRLRIYESSEGFTLRAEIVLTSGERVSSIPVVDREWRRFAQKAVKRIQRTDPLPLADRFLNRTLATKLLESPQRFARIGLPRPRGEPECWLMLDSLFPQPQEDWLEAL